MRVSIQKLMINKDRIWLKSMKLGKEYGCHQKPERSFFINGYQFPICARCTGIVISTIIAILVYKKKEIHLVRSFVLLVPMALDGGIQYYGILESHNGRRFITGLLGGFGATTIRLMVCRTLWKKLLSGIEGW